MPGNVAGSDPQTTPQAFGQGVHLLTLLAGGEREAESPAPVCRYETRKAVDEYLQFHYGRPEDLFPYAEGPKVSAGARMSSAGRAPYSRHGRRSCCTSVRQVRRR